MARKQLIVFLRKNGPQLYRVARRQSLKIAEGDSVWSAIANHQVRLVVADELCYLLNLEIEGDINRSRVKEAIASEIPENLTDNWDFAKFPGQNRVFVFALIGDYQRLLQNLSQKFSFKILALEPESVAVKRNPDPVLGLALKNDFNQKDENSLNLTIGQPANSSGSKILFIFVIITGLVVTTFFTFKIFTMLY